MLSRFLTIVLLARLTVHTILIAMLCGAGCRRNAARDIDGVFIKLVFYEGEVRQRVPGHAHSANGTQEKGGGVGES